MLVGYASAKPKSRAWLSYFLEGARRCGEPTRLLTEMPAQLVDDAAAVFYGPDATNLHLFRQARAGRDWYYIDNSYFDASRGTYYRVTRGAVQHTALTHSTGARFRALGIEIQPWRSGGAHVLVCPQSDAFMHDIAEQPGDWTARTVEELRRHTQREIRVHGWGKDKIALGRTLPEALRDAWALVTWSSAAAVTALLEGVPAFVGDVQCAAWSLSGWSLRHIETPRHPDWREQWAGVLADNQWTLDELRDGTAWRKLNA